jgi:hypothetical protein
MMFGRMMLCKIIGGVSRTAPPIDMVLVLPNAVSNPIESHIHGFESFLFYGFVGDAAGRGVVSDHRGGRLFVAQFFEGDAKWCSFFTIVEKGG